MNKVNNNIILSASRMTDMPKFYPHDIINEVNKRIEKSVHVHTLVLWTKHHYSLLTNPLCTYLKNLRSNGTQIFIQLTITGMGKLSVGSKSNGKPLVLEPNVPHFEDSINSLSELIELTGKADRVRLRIDPVLKISDSNNNTFSNLELFPVILAKASEYGIRNFSFSFLEKDAHAKVERRFKKIGCNILSFEDAERVELSRYFKSLETKHSVIISACCTPGFSESRCIDGHLLQQLHDDILPLNFNEPRKRAMCGCTNSIDIGGWPPKKCYSGCDYCYANSQYVD